MTNMLIREFEDAKAPDPGWIWPGHFAKGTLTLLAGKGGIGKSTLAATIAAYATNGVPWPDAPGVAREPMSVLYATAHDSMHAVADRALRANATVERIHLLNWSGLTWPTSGGPIANIEDMAGRVPSPLGLIIIDPMESLFSTGYAPEIIEAKRIFAQCISLARRHGAALLMIASQPCGVPCGCPITAEANRASRQVWRVKPDSDDARSRVIRLGKHFFNVPRPRSFDLSLGHDGRLQINARSSEEKTS